MGYWQAVRNEFLNRYAKDYPFNFTTVRYYPENEEEREKQILRRHKYYFDKSKSLYLTQREADCIYHLCLDLTIKETAEELLLSPRSVEFYLQRIKDKFKIRYKKDLLIYFKTHRCYASFFSKMEKEFNA